MLSNVDNRGFVDGAFACVILELHKVSEKAKNEDKDKGSKMYRSVVIVVTYLTLVETRITNVDPNATISFFFTADPQFGWGASYSGNEER